MRFSIAWHGLPFYAAESLLHLRSSNVVGEFDVIATDDKGSIRGSKLDRDLSVLWISRELPCSFYDLGLAIPDVLLKTSWCHPAFESLADDVRRSGGHVVMMADNMFHWRFRKLLGPIYGRLFLKKKHRAVIVPGVCAKKYMRWFGFEGDVIFERLYCSNSRRFQAGNSRRKRSVLFVGRFEMEKNVRTLVAAWRRYKQSDGYFQSLHLVGSGSEDLTPDPAFGVSVSPWLSQGEIATLMRDADAFVLPSKQEHWGVVLLEAALSGCVLMATDRCGAAYDLISNGKNGIRVSGYSEEALFLAFSDLEKILLDKMRRSEARILSRAYGMRFSVDRFVSMIEKLQHFLFCLE